jgi:hypothetical protein
MAKRFYCHYFRLYFEVTPEEVIQQTRAARHLHQ